MIYLANAWLARIRQQGFKECDEAPDIGDETPALRDEMGQFSLAANLIGTRL
jgi:hypothetical protein